jgi:hypothetical protein
MAVAVDGDLGGDDIDTDTDARNMNTVEADACIVVRQRMLLEKWFDSLVGMPPSRVLLCSRERGFNVCIG